MDDNTINERITSLITRRNDITQNLLNFLNGEISNIEGWHSLWEEEAELKKESLELFNIRGQQNINSIG